MERRHCPGGLPALSGPFAASRLRVTGGLWRLRVTGGLWRRRVTGDGELRVTGRWLAQGDREGGHLEGQLEGLTRRQGSGRIAVDMVRDAAPSVNGIALAQLGWWWYAGKNGGRVATP